MYNERLLSSLNRKDSVPCIVSGSSSESNLNTNFRMESVSNEYYKSDVNLHPTNMPNEQIYSQQERCHAGFSREGDENEMTNKETRSIYNYHLNVTPHPVRNIYVRDYSTLKLELSDLYNTCSQQSDTRVKPNLNSLRDQNFKTVVHDHYMIPTHNQSEVNKRALSLFNPQFLPNFNDMLMCVAQYGSNEGLGFFSGNNDICTSNKTTSYRSRSINSYIPNIDYQRNGTSDTSRNLDTNQTDVNVQVRRCLGLRETTCNFEREDKNIYVLKQNLKENSQKDQL